MEWHVTRHPLNSHSWEQFAETVIRVGPEAEGSERVAIGVADGVPIEAA